VGSFRAQLKAIHRWGQQNPADLASIHQPVLVMNGESDKMVPTKNTVDLDRRLPNSQLVVYPTPGTAGCSSSTRTSSSGRSSSYESSPGRTVMKAFVVERYGKDGLRAADVPDPEIGDADVLIKVSAAGINPLDKMVRNGEFKRLLEVPHPVRAGHDVAGVVTRVGSAVRDFQVGDEAYARPRDLRIGTFAQYIAIDQDDVAPKPASAHPAPGGRVPLVSLAAWQALVDRAHVKPGQKVLVHAGPAAWGRPSSSSPSTSRHGGDDRPRRERGAGAQPRRGRRGGLHEGGLRRGPLRLRRRVGLARARTSRGPSRSSSRPDSDQRDRPAGPRVREAARAPKLMGVVMGLLSRKVRKQARRLGVSYSFLFMQANGGQLRELASLYDAGHLRPLIDKTFPFDQTLEALAYVEQGRANGKVVITLD